LAVPIGDLAGNLAADLGGERAAAQLLRLAPLGSVLRAAGVPMRTPRVGSRGGVLSLVAAAQDVQLLRHTPQPDSVPLAPHVPPPPPRFHLTPNTVRWHRALGLLNVGAHNTFGWRGGLPLPLPPPPPPGTTTRLGPWLLPASDAAALAIAQQQEELRAAGWRLLTCGATLA